MMQILEFPDAAVPGLEHFEIKLGRDMVQIVGLNSLEVVIHDLAPGPKTVFAIAGALAESRHRPLMSVRVNVRNCRN